MRRRIVFRILSGPNAYLMNNRKGFQIYLWLRWARKFGQVAK